jgi:hypothetical protein
MEMEIVYLAHAYVEGYRWDDNVLKRNPLKGKVTPITKSKSHKGGGIVDGFVFSSEGFSHRPVKANFWSEFIKVIDPFFDAKIRPQNLIETIDPKSDLYNETIANQIKDNILNFVNEWGFDSQEKIWTEDVDYKLEPTLLNICMEAFMLRDGISLSLSELANDTSYASKINQSYMKLTLGGFWYFNEGSDNGYQMTVMGFWDCIYRSFSFDKKRAFAKLCVRCGKPFVGKTTKKKHCTDTCKWNEWKDRQEAEKLGEKK